ncbi:MAG TPA: RT0821/Lpp0805 family surface protein [Azospirillaceae bacterium]|nr:RT0821/Lpp0805 family surface protein [Azospirillaceae bacterium]
MGIGRFLTCGALALTLAACQSGSTGETVGMLGGAAGGALIGSQFGKGGGQIAMTALGTLAGALAGRELGRYLDPDDQQRANRAESRALAANEPVRWGDASGGRYGVVEPVRSYQGSYGQTCRDYTHTIYIDGRAETARGTACRMADGSWQVVG